MGMGARLASALILFSLMAASAVPQSRTVLRYGHMNSDDSVAGQQARFFAQRVKELSGGSLSVEVYPASQLGSLQEEAEEVARGEIAIHHNTAAGIGSLYEDFAVLDTPYLFSGVDQLLKVTSPDSPVMRRLGDGLLKEKGLRLLYVFYYGTRQLTCNRPILKPKDLSGIRIRSIPFPIYEATVEALGAISTPIDWSQTPTALAAGVVDGEENPVDTILSARLYESQHYLMLTGHTIAAELVVMNEDVWKGLSAQFQTILSRAGIEASRYASQAVVKSEALDLEKLKAHGMVVIGPGQGLDIEAFRQREKAMIEKDYASKWREYYSLINMMK